MADQGNTTGTPPPSDGSAQPPKDGMAEIKKKIEDAKRKETEDTKRQEAETAQRVVEQITALKIAMNDANTKALRALADLQNARKRMEEEKATFATFATKKIILELIEVAENFDRVMASKPKEVTNVEWLKGLELVHQQLEKIFAAHGVKKIQVKVGEKIDPSKHEAVMAGEGEEGLILEVFSQGYEMAGKLIRAARVKVGKKG